MSSSLRPADESVISLHPASLELPEADYSRLAILVRTFHEQLERKGKEDVSTKMLASQIVLALIGALAGFLYYDPSAICAEGEGGCDDQWLAKAVPDELVRQYLYFISGFVGYATTNCTFSYFAPREYFDLMSQKNPHVVKALQTGGVIGFTLLQGVQIFLAAEGTKSSPLNMVMTVTGATPGAIFGAVALVKGIPSLLSATCTSLQDFYYNCRPSSLNAAQQKDLVMTAFYARQRQQLAELIHANWKAVIRNLDKLAIQGDEDPMTFLLGQEAVPVAESLWRKGVRHLAQSVVGPALTASFVSPMFYNSYQIINSHFDMPVLNAIGVSLLNATGIYGHLYLTCKALGAAADTSMDVLSGEPVQSLVYQLRPWTTRAMFVGSSAFAMLSYAVIDMMFNKMWAPSSDSPWDGSAQASLRGAARTGIVAYHVAGPMKVGMELLFRRLLVHGTPPEKFLARVWLMVNFLTVEMKQQEFVKYLSEDSSPDVRAMLNVQSWDDFMAELHGLGVGSEAYHQRIAALGLEGYAGIAQLASSGYQGVAAEVSVSASASHWQSSQFLLSQGQRQQMSETSQIESPRLSSKP